MNESNATSAVSAVDATYIGNATAYNTAAIRSDYAGDYTLEYNPDWFRGYSNATATTTTIGYTYHSPYEQILEQLQELRIAVDEIRDALHLLQSATLQKAEELV